MLRLLLMLLSDVSVDLLCQEAQALVAVVRAKHIFCLSLLLVSHILKLRLLSMRCNRLDIEIIPALR